LGQCSLVCATLAIELRSVSAKCQKQTLQSVRPMCALPPKRTLVERVGMSALCQKQTSSVSKLFRFKSPTLDHLIGWLVGIQQPLGLVGA